MQIRLELGLVPALVLRPGLVDRYVKDAKAYFGRGVWEAKGGHGAKIWSCPITRGQMPI